MVQIPEYEAEVAPRPPEYPNVAGQMDMAPYRALSEVGSAEVGLAQRVDQFNEQRGFQQAQIGLLDLNHKFHDQYNDILLNAPPNGAGIEQKANETIQPLIDNYLQSIPDPRVRARMAPHLEGVKTQWLDKANDDELGRVRDYSTNSIVQFSGNSAQVISTQPQLFNDELKKGHDLINASPGLSPTEKQGAIYKYDALMKDILARRLGLPDMDQQIKYFMMGGRSNFDERTTWLVRQAILPLMGAESSYGRNNVGPLLKSGERALGPAQILSSTALDIAREVGDQSYLNATPNQRTRMLMDWRTSSLYGAYYLGKMLRQNGGDLELGLIAYNAGQKRADEFVQAGRDWSRVGAWGKKTQPYVQKITGAMGAKALVGVVSGGSYDPAFFLSRYEGDKPPHAQMNMQFGSGLQEALSDAEAATGSKAVLRSLSRTGPEQVADYQDYRSGRGGLAAVPAGWRRPDGRISSGSRHERGMAADINSGPALDWLRSPDPENPGRMMANRYGLEFLPHGIDRGHIQLAAQAGGTGAAAGQSVQGAGPPTAAPFAPYRVAGTQWVGPPQAPPVVSPNASVSQWTPQEQFLYQHHLNNLNGDGKVLNSNGTISTVMDGTAEFDGRYYIFPHVWDGKVLSNKEAEARAAAVGWDKWPSYSSEDEANARYDQMHAVMESDVQQFQQGANQGDQGDGWVSPLFEGMNPADFSGHQADAITAYERAQTLDKAAQDSIKYVTENQMDNAVASMEQSGKSSVDDMNALRQQILVGFGNEGPARVMKFDRDMARSSVIYSSTKGMEGMTDEQINAIVERLKPTGGPYAADEQYVYDKVSAAATTAKAARDSVTKSRAEKAANGYMQKAIPSENAAELHAMLPAIATDPNLDSTSKRIIADSVRARIKELDDGTAQKVGPKYNEVLTDIIEGRIGSSIDIYRRVTSGDITNQGAEALVVALEHMRKGTPESSYVLRKSDAMNAAKGYITFDGEEKPYGRGKLSDPEGLKAYHKFVDEFEKDLNIAIASGPAAVDKFLNPENIAKLAQTFRKPSDLAAARLRGDVNAAGDLTDEQGANIMPPPPPGIQPEDWTNVMTRMPTDPQGRAFTQVQWGKVVNYVLQHANEPDMLADFDAHVEPGGITSRDILRTLRPMPSLPVQPPMPLPYRIPFVKSGAVGKGGPPQPPVPQSGQSGPATPALIDQGLGALDSVTGAASGAISGVGQTVHDFLVRPRGK